MGTLSEVTVTASRITLNAPSLLASVASNTFSYMNGLANSYSSNMTLGLVKEVDPNNYKNSDSFESGQTAGRYLAMAQGAAEFIIGGIAAGGGGALTLTGGGAVVGVPAIAFGIPLALHGGTVSVYTAANIARVHMLNSTPGKTSSKKSNT